MPEQPAQKPQTKPTGLIVEQNSALLIAFPFGFSVNPDGEIVTLGRSLQKFAPWLLSSSVVDTLAFDPPMDILVQSQDPCGNLRVVRLNGQRHLSLRGQFVAHEKPLLATFVGSVYVQNLSELISLGIESNDFAAHDLTTEMAMVSNAQTSHIEEISDLNARLEGEFAAKQELMAAQELAAKQLRLAADMRLIVNNGTIEDLQIDSSVCQALLEKRDLAGSPTEVKNNNNDSPISLLAAIPQLEKVDGLPELIAGRTASLNFEFSHRLGDREYFFECQCEQIDYKEHSARTLMLIRDVTTDRELQQVLERQANVDQLTGLYNRRVLREELNAIYSGQSKYHVDDSFLVIIDLDDFKSVNDLLGHSAGDQVLKLASKRVRDVLRESDLIARLGGDEFAVLLRGLNDSDEALRSLLHRIQKCLEEELLLDGFSWKLGCSIGIASLATAKDAENILSSADLTMYDAKRSGKGRIAYYSDQLKNATLRQMRIQQRLRIAIAERSVVSHFQPVFDLDDGSIVAFESLARWTDTDLGVVGPDEFIAVAERSNLIFDLSESILRNTLQDFSTLTRRHEQLQDCSLHINVSPQIFTLPNTCDLLFSTCAEFKIDPSRLVVEVTESVMMNNIEAARKQCMRMAEGNIRLAIDDFGKGYSSLGYLEAFPFDILKIDRQFVANLHNRRTTYRLTLAIVNLALALGMSTIAEGIEVTEELTELRQLGCNQGQGFLLAKPMSADAITDWLEQRAIDNPGVSMMKRSSL